MENPKFGSWDEWGRHVLAELQRANNSIEVMEGELSNFKKETSLEILQLKMKAGIYGLLAGGIPIAIAVLIERFISK